ncbi:MAG: CHAT domain-containing protein [Desulfobacterales bacterium]|nr:CHAT domain-containing protein [Desulfobacterales bacterium]
MKKAKILVADDDLDLVTLIKEHLVYLGYQVVIAHNGIEVLEKVKENKPDLIVLDIVMPEMNGYEVCEKLKSSSSTKNIPILMLTAKDQQQDKIEGFNKGADQYLTKPYDEAEFEAIIKALLKRSTSLPFDAIQDDSVFSISCKPEHPLNIRVRGVFALNAMSEGSLHLQTDVYNRYGNNAYILDEWCSKNKQTGKWRFQSKQTGKQLYQEIFYRYPEVLSNYNRALGAIKTEEKLHIRFESDREFLRVPLEFLYSDEEYFVLKYPIARSISSISIKKKAISPTFFNELYLDQKELRILFIASNTNPSIPGVDQEIDSLNTSVKTLFEDTGILIRLKMIPTQEATYEAVRKELKNCNYHIIHYAGHGRYDRNSPEKSSIFFWKETNLQGGVKPMPISELKMLLQNSNVHFAYLSCCLGASTGESAKLLDDDFLGIAEGLVQAGIPSVLGFRWPVSDSGAISIALEFYSSLAKQGKIDVALLNARREVAAKDRDDITWISPILVMQD